MKKFQNIQRIINHKFQNSIREFCCIMDIQEEIRIFVENGAMTMMILRENNILFPHIRFVDFNFKTRVVRVLVCGDCPNCEKPYLKNTCTFKYVKTVLKPVITRQFRTIEDVLPISTHDVDFIRIVASKGGVVSFPFRNNLRMRLFDLKVFLYDCHPDVDCLMKFSDSLVETPPDWSNEDLVSANEYLSNYEICWYLDDTTVIYYNNTTIIGRQNIIEANTEGRLPDGLHLRNLHMLVSTTSNFFDGRRYIVVIFPNGYI